jgi:hypothetical protein
MTVNHTIYCSQCEREFHAPERKGVGYSECKTHNREREQKRRDADKSKWAQRKARWAKLKREQ